MTSPILDPLALSIPLSTPVHLRPADPTLPTRKLLYSGDTPDSYVLEIDNSSLEKFTTCPRAAENYLVHSRESARDGSATSFGGLFHRCEELRLRHGLSPDIVVQQRELVHEHFLHNPPSPEDHRTEARMVQVLDLYNDRYAKDGWPERVLVHEGEKMVERAYKVELCSLELNTEIPYTADEIIVPTSDLRDPLNPRYKWSAVFCSTLHVLWTGRIDAVLQELDNQTLWVVDHKTSSIGGEGYYEDFKLSQQTIGYCWAAQKLLQRPVMGLLLNALILRKPTRTGNANEFDRKNYFYSEDRITEWEENTKHIVADFVSNLVRGFFPQHTKWCLGKYGKCPYHENCSLPKQQRAADLSTDLYRNVTWNPIH